MKLRQIINLAGIITIAKVFKRRIPIKVKQYITYRCNLTCPFCARRTIISASEMTTVQIKEMMKEFKDMGTAFWEFSGGEPLLREDLGELIDYAKNTMGFHLSLATNGVFLSKMLERAPSFKKLDFVQISLEGPREIQDRLRGKGTFDKVIGALDMLKRLNIRSKISTVITKDNLTYFDYLIQLAIQYGAVITFEPMTIHPQDKQGLTNQFFPEKNTFQMFIDRLIKEKETDSPIISSLEYLKMVRDLWSEGSIPMRCCAGQFYCDITPDGFVVPCCVKLEQRKDEVCGLSTSFKKAFFKLGDMSQCDLPCYCSGPQELNIVFDMVPMKIARIYRNYSRRRII